MAIYAVDNKYRISVVPEMPPLWFDCLISETSQQPLGLEIETFPKRFQSCSGSSGAVITFSPIFTESHSHKQLYGRPLSSQFCSAISQLAVYDAIFSTKKTVCPELKLKDANFS